MLVHRSRESIHDVQINFDLRVGVIGHHILRVFVPSNALKSWRGDDVGLIALYAGSS